MMVNFRQFNIHRLALTIVFMLLLLFPLAGMAEDYIVGPGDVLKITVYNHNDLLTTVRVTDDGFIAMPLLGQVKVQGMNTTEITTELTKLLASGYIVNPQVNIFIEEFRSKKVVVLGHVNKPGLVELRGTTNFLEIMSQAGGLKDGAGETATIKRVKNGKQEVIVLNLKSMVEGGDLHQNIAIFDGDTIYISEGGTCYVSGEVSKPNGYPCAQGATVLKLITLAGGFTGKASKSGISIVRIVDGQKTVLKDVELSTTVITDDIIVVPESFF
jgi:polysaccharide export outer membrane protein